MKMLVVKAKAVMVLSRQRSALAALVDCQLRYREDLWMPQLPFVVALVFVLAPSWWMLFVNDFPYLSSNVNRQGRSGFV